MSLLFEARGRIYNFEDCRSGRIFDFHDDKRLNEMQQGFKARSDYEYLSEELRLSFTLVIRCNIRLMYFYSTY